MHVFDRPFPLCNTLPQPIGSATSSVALQQMRLASRLIYVDGEQSSRANRMAWARERWIGGRPGRDIVITRCGNNGNAEHWVVVFFEDAKGILNVRGMTAEDALAQGFAMLSASKPK